MTHMHIENKKIFTEIPAKSVSWSLNSHSISYVYKLFHTNKSEKCKPVQEIWNNFLRGTGSKLLISIKWITTLKKTPTHTHTNTKVKE